MQEFLGMIYYWLKAGHILFVIFWMAGLFMLPRFFIYHQESEPGSREDLAWIEREARLLKIILNPAIGVVWLLGLALAVSTGAFTQGWFHAKLALVLGLSGYQGWMTSYARKLSKGERPLPGKTLRMLNEVPGIAAALIVVLVVIRPF
jgi:putative membrane protein